MCRKGEGQVRRIYSQVYLIVRESPCACILAESAGAVLVEPYITLELFKYLSRSAGISTISKETVAGPCMGCKQREPLRGLVLVA